MSSTVLIENILANAVLSEAVDKMEKRTGALNLVRPDWRQVLERSQTYDRHSRRQVRFSKGHESTKGIHVRNVIGADNQYNLIVAGVFSLLLKRTDPIDEEKIHDTVFVNRDCPALQIVGDSMAERAEQKFQDNCKLFVEKCDPNICECCSRYGSNRRDEDDNWCLKMSRAFNGERIKYYFRSGIESTFGQLNSFGAVVNVCVGSRITFGEDSYKIGGQILEFILFKESTLKPVEMDLDVDFVPMAILPAPAAALGAPIVEEIENCIPKNLGNTTADKKRKK